MMKTHPKLARSSGQVSLGRTYVKASYLLRDLLNLGPSRRKSKPLHLGHKERIINKTTIPKQTPPGWWPSTFEAKRCHFQKPSPAWVLKSLSLPATGDSRRGRPQRSPDAVFLSNGPGDPTSGLDPCSTKTIRALT